MDEEGLLDGVLRHADVHNPFRVRLSAVAMRQIFRGNAKGSHESRKETGEVTLLAFGSRFRCVGTTTGKTGASTFAVEIIDCFFNCRGVPTLGFRVIVAKGCGFPCGSRGPEGSFGISMEWGEMGVRIDGVSRSDDGSPVQVFVGCDETVWVDSLPDGEKTIGVGVVQPENRIKSRIIDLQLDQNPREDDQGLERWFTLT